MRSLIPQFSTIVVILTALVVTTVQANKISRYNEMLNAILMNYEIELVCNACKVTDCDNPFSCPDLKICDNCKTYLRVVHDKWAKQAFLNGSRWLKNDEWGTVYYEMKDMLGLDYYFKSRGKENERDQSSDRKMSELNRKNHD